MKPDVKCYRPDCTAKAQYVIHWTKYHYPSSEPICAHHADFYRQVCPEVGTTLAR